MIVSVLVDVGADSCSSDNSLSLEAPSAGSLVASHFLLSSLQHRTCALSLRTDRGKQISVTLVNFRRRSFRSVSGGGYSGYSASAPCYKYATIMDTYASFPVTSCASGERITTTYVSKLSHVELLLENHRGQNVSFFFFIKGKLRTSASHEN